MFIYEAYVQLIPTAYMLHESRAITDKSYINYFSLNSTVCDWINTDLTEDNSNKLSGTQSWWVLVS